MSHATTNLTGTRTGRTPPATIFARPQSPPGAGPLTASLAFAWRSVLKIRHVPEQLGDVIGIPVLFTLMFTYLFGGAITGSTGRYLQYLLPGTLALAVVFVTVYSGITLNRDCATGAFDRFRSMPLWRPAPIVGGLIGDIGRYLLASSLVIGLGLIMGFHAPWRGPRGRRGGRPGADLRLRAFLGLDHAGADPAHPERRHEHRLRDPVPAHLHEQHLRRPAHDAPLAAHHRRPQPGQPPGHRRAQPHAGHPAAGQVLWVLAAAAALTAVFAPLTIQLFRSKS